MIATAAELDRQDELASFRQRFFIDDPDLIYLDGNSLGRMPLAALEAVKRATEFEWGSRLVRGWPEGWVGAPARIGAKIAEIIGAQPDEVVLSDSTTVNLFKLVVAALRGNPGRPYVVTDDLNFPSDHYAITGAIDFLREGHELQVIRSANRIHISSDQVAGALTENTALFTASHTSFKSAFVYDMKAVSAAAHEVGALTLWDLSHSVGSIPVALNESNADLAIGCTYKYLNGGPGSPAFLYVRRDLQEKLSSPIHGWFGQRDPFAFDLSYTPREGIGRFLVGTPPILSSLAAEPGIDLTVEAGMDRIRAKSVRQTEFLIDLYDRVLKPLGMVLNSPRDSSCRGSHVSFGHPEAMRICKALINDENVIPDFRMPDNIRYGASPLYTTFTELEEGVESLAKVVRERRFERYDSERPNVT